MIGKIDSSFDGYFLELHMIYWYQMLFTAKDIQPTVLSNFKVIINLYNLNNASWYLEIVLLIHIDIVP